MGSVPWRDSAASDVLLTFDIAWVPVEPSCRLGLVLGLRVELFFPWFLDQPRWRPPGGAFQSVLDPKALTLGILLSGERRGPRHSPSPSPDQLRVALRLLTEEAGLGSADELCAEAVGYLCTQHGVSPALDALRRAFTLLPDCPRCGILLAILNPSEPRAGA